MPFRIPVTRNVNLPTRRHRHERRFYRCAVGHRLSLHTITVLVQHVNLRIAMRAKIADENTNEVVNAACFGINERRQLAINSGDAGRPSHDTVKSRWPDSSSEMSELRDASTAIDEAGDILPGRLPIHR